MSDSSPSSESVEAKQKKSLVEFLTELWYHGKISWDFDEQQADATHKFWKGQLLGWVEILRSPKQPDLGLPEAPSDHVNAVRQKEPMIYLQLRSERVSFSGRQPISKVKSMVDFILECDRDASQTSEEKVK